MFIWYGDNVIPIYNYAMNGGCDKIPERVNIGTMVTPEYRSMFHARCIEYGMTMSDVIMGGIKEFMASHPPKVEKFQGVI